MKVLRGELQREITTEIAIHDLLDWHHEGVSVLGAIYGGIGTVEADAYDEALTESGCTFRVDCEHLTNSEIAWLFIAFLDGSGRWQWQT